MWCPEGYLRWNEFRDRCVHESLEYFRNKREGTVKPFSEEARQTAVWGQAMGLWLLQEALEKGILSCCSTTGVCLRIDTKDCGLFLNDESDDSETTANGGTGQEWWHPVCDEGEPPQEWLDLQFRTDYTFLHLATGLISRPSRKMDERKRTYFSGIEDASWRISITNSWIELMILSIKLDGWALCIKEDVMEQFLADIFSQSNSNPLATIDNSLSVGRPRSRERAAEAYLKLFPNGRGKIPWKQVVRHIKTQEGVIASPITIKRGLEELGQNPDQNPD